MVRVRGLLVAMCVALLTLVIAGCGGGMTQPRRATPTFGGEAHATPPADGGGDGVAPTVEGAALSQEPGGHACAPPYPASRPTVSNVFCADPGAMEAATVTRVVDGDTMHVLLDGRDETIRFYGINATEVGQPCSAEATDRTRELVGHEVRLRPDARERDVYGRLLRYVYTPAGLSVDAELVDEGLAHAWRSDGALRLPIIALEDAAQARGAGCLWK